MNILSTTAAGHPASNGPCSPQADHNRGGIVVAEVVVLGAGLSGTLMAYELVRELRREDRLTVVGQGLRYHFVPSNPWVAVGWRQRQEIEVDLETVMRR